MAKKNLKISEKNWEDNLADAIKNDKYKTGIADWLGVSEGKIADVPAIKNWKKEGEAAIKDEKYKKGVKAYWLESSE